MNNLNMPERTGFKPFTRVISAPAAWPWDQARAARLEAEHTSPVSGDDVTIVVRRLKAWAWNTPGRFVAVYLRGVDLRQGLKFDLDIQGQRVSIDMPSPQQKAAQSRDRALVMVLGGLMVAGLLGMGSLTLHRRAAEADRLDQLKTRLGHQARAAEALRRAGDDAQALSDLGVKNQTLDQALADLKAVSLKRDPGARLDAFYWNRGYWAVEVRGDTPPLQDATVPLQKSTRPVRKGVWLWVSAMKDGGGS